MKILFVESKKRPNPNLETIDFSILPKEIFLAYSIQFKEIAEKIKKALGKRVKGFSAVLGCSKLKTSYPVLLVGSGRFHAINLALKGNTVYILEEDRIYKLDEKEVERIKSKRKAALARFYSAEKVGLLVSTKRGQENIKKALELKKRLKKKGKEVLLFLGDNITPGELENYDIASWVNTACPSLSFESNIVNAEELEE